MTPASTPGAEQGTDHIEQQQELDTLEEEAGIPTNLDNPRAPGGTVVKEPKGEPRTPEDAPRRKNDPSAG
jgi:hypothetical protein